MLSYFTSHCSNKIINIFLIYDYYFHHSPLSIIRSTLLKPQLIYITIIFIEIIQWMLGIFHNLLNVVNNIFRKVKDAAGKYDGYAWYPIVAS